MDRAACIVCPDPAGDHAFMCKVCQKPVHGRCGSIKDEECLTCIKDRNRRLGLEIGRAAFFLVCLLVILRMVVIPLLAWYSVPPSTDDSVRFVYTERRVCEFFGNCDDADEIKPVRWPWFTCQGPGGRMGQLQADGTCVVAL